MNNMSRNIIMDKWFIRMMCKMVLNVQNGAENPVSMNEPVENVKIFLQIASQGSSVQVHLMKDMFSEMMQKIDNF